MQARERGKDRHCNIIGLTVVVLGLAALGGGCGTTIETPLPDFAPATSPSLSQQERQNAVDELTRKRATHEQDAEQAIEQSR
jgi:hypothetical protein